MPIFSRDPPKDIVWMSSPLGIDQREAILKRLPMIKGTRFDPKEKQTHVFQNIRHWTLQIGDHCYELWPVLGVKVGAIPSKLTDLVGGNTCKPRWVSASEWLHEKEVKQNVKIERRRVGQTRLSEKKIQAEVDRLWEKFHGKWYGFFTQNCQNFAALLFTAVAIKIPESEKSLWEEIPDPAVYTLAKVSRVSLAGQMVLTTWSAGIAAMSAADALAVGAVTAAAATQAQGVGAMAGTGTQAGAVGVAGSQAGAAGAATSQAGAVGAAGSQAGSAGAISSTAAGTQAGAASAAGTQSGAAAAAGTTQATGTTTATAAKGGATAGKATAAAGKAGGVSAKLAAASHGALPKAALLAGKGVAVINPVTAIGGIALTGYIHHKYKKHKAFKHRLQAHDQDGEEGQPFSMEKMLEKEDKLFEEAEKEDEEVDAEFEEELCEGLELKHVETEPAEMLEGESIVEGEKPVGFDERRTQTLA